MPVLSVWSLTFLLQTGSLCLFSKLPIDQGGILNPESTSLQFMAPAQLGLDGDAGKDNDGDDNDDGDGDDHDIYIIEDINIVDDDGDDHDSASSS